MKASHRRADDRARALFAAIEAAVGAVMVLGGLAIARSVVILALFGLLLVVWGLIAIVHALAIGLRASPVPGCDRRSVRS